MSEKNKKMSKFVAENLKKFNKTEAEQQQEKIERFVEDSIIEAETQIAIVKTSRIPHLQNELKRLEINLKRAHQNYEESRFATASSFSSYVEKRENALDLIESAESTIQVKKQQIQEAENELRSLESILGDLKM